MEFFYVKIIVIGLIFLFFIRVFIAYNSKNLNLKGYDIVGKPGYEYLLKCKLQTSNILGFDKSDEIINFYLNGELIGSCVTGVNGVAEIKYSFDKPGTHVVKIGINGKSKYKAESGKIVAGIYNSKKPILICDIDHTVCDTKLLLFLLNKDTKIPAIQNSSESLNNIAHKYEIIYVTHRDSAFIHKTKFWLDLFNYPAGPIFFWNFGKYTFNNEKYKESIIRNLKEQFPNIIVGIGDKKSDALAYIRNNLKTILIKDKKQDDLPDDVIQLKKWKYIEEYLIDREEISK